MNKLTKLMLKMLLLIAGVSFYISANAAFVHLNSTGGVTTSDGLHIIIDDSTQLQVVRNKTGQVYSPTYTPDRNFNITYFNNSTNNPLVNTSTSRLDNGIYIRGNKTIYGPNHFAAASSSPSAYTTVPITGPTPATASQGIAQTATSQFTVPYNSLVSGPTVTINWSYIFPYDFVTANVTVVIPALYPVNSSNPVRYYHVVDTYLGGSDYGCGVRYVDTNNKQVIGTYPQTSSGCPTSTGLPANLDVVETFRERDGLKFTHYCVGFYDFWGTSSSTDCDITSSSVLNDTVSKTYKDTGMAIEYDFTSPGTYTFSYDFVVGSTAVPNYDHLEIRHSGTSTLCPTDVKVLACLSSTVPCPDAQMLYSGSLTGDLVVTPSTPAITKSPNQSFNIGSNGAIATYSLQPSSAATYILSASGLNVTPLNGIKCWNTATSSQSCSLTFTSTPCVDKFECMENTLTYNNQTANPGLRNPLYTKVLGQDFDVDVVALLANGNQSSGYNSVSGLTVDLVLENANTCSTNLTDIVATQSVTFSSSDNGRKKVTFPAQALLVGYPKMAYPILRCRVRDLTLGKSGCSSDNFAIRPQSLSVSATNTSSASTPSSTSTPVFRASKDVFSLTVSSGDLGYNGTPKIKPATINPLYTPLVSHSNAVATGIISGTFPAAVAGSSSGTSFTYSEVGHFKFRANEIYDDTFAAVDVANSDCDSSSNPYDSVGSGTPKKYGCYFGNTVETLYFGRFIPDHFTVTSLSNTLACNAFAYYGQDTPGVTTQFTMTAQNGAGGTTQNYTYTSTNNYAKFDLSTWGNYQFTATQANGNPLSGGATYGSSSVSPAVSGTPWASGVTTVTARHQLSRPSSQTSPQTVAIYTQPQETDNARTVTSTKTTLTNSATYRYGRLSVIPSHGSELLPLPVQIEAQYWNGSAYIRNIDDSCTVVPLSSIVMKNYKGNLNACETVLSGSSAMSSGKMNLKLSAPGVDTSSQPNVPNTGSVDLEVNLGALTAGEKTCISTTESAAISGALSTWMGNVDPSGRASFGIYKAPIIYMRENF